MYRVVLHKRGPVAGYFQETVSGDSLHEAEQAALHFLSEHFRGKSVIMVHVGALVYDVYQVGSPIAQIQIESR